MSGHEHGVDEAPAHGGPGEASRVGGVGCPLCACPDVPVIPRRNRPDGFFLMQAPRRCSACECLFVPPSSMRLRVMAVVFGLAVFGMSVGEYVWPGLVGLVSAERSFRDVMQLIVGGMSALYAVRILRIAAMSGTACVLDAAQPAD